MKPRSSVPAEAMIRTPAVAGTFYPGDPKTLVETVSGFIEKREDTESALAVVVPHAGYVYSGHVAGAVYSRLQLPDRFIILCPNHTGLGRPLAIMSEGEWETPMGRVAIESELAARLKHNDGDLEEDVEAHLTEHSLEVQLPFLQHLAGSGAQFVPITVGTSDLGCLKRLGEAMAKTIREVPTEVLIVASSDMNHYEPDGPTRIKDRKAIEKMLELDAEGLYRTVRDERISMCGFGPATSTLIAANLLGASNAELVRYATSGDIFGERDRVVGYAGIVFK